MNRVAALVTIFSLSLMLKLGLLFHGYFDGFLTGDLDVTAPDEYTYLEDGRSLDLLRDKYSFGNSWLYVYLNYLAFNVSSDSHVVYLLLCFMNIALSFISPFLLLPVIRDYFKDDAKYRYAALIFIALTLLWPEAAYVAVKNLKDTLLQVLVSAYVLVFYLFMKKVDSVDIRRRELVIYFLAAAGLILLIFSLRSYLAAILFAISFFPVLTRKPFLALLGVAVVAATIAAYPAPFVGFIENNFLFSADAAKDLQEQLYRQGMDALRINQDFVGISTGFLRFFLWPTPTTPHDLVQVLEILQSTVVYLLAFFWIRGIRKAPPNFRSFTLWLFFAVGLFYGIAELFSGPRQRFSSFDYFFLASVSAGLTELKVSDIASSLSIAFLIFVVARLIGLPI